MYFSKTFSYLLAIYFFMVYSKDRFVSIIWDGKNRERVTSLGKTIRAVARELDAYDTEDSSVALYEPIGNGKFRLKFAKGYLCKKPNDPGVVLCDDKSEKYTEWQMLDQGRPGQIKTEDNCLRRMREDKRVKYAGRYLNAASCDLNNNDKWLLEDVNLEEEDDEESSETQKDKKHSEDDKIIPMMTGFTSISKPLIVNQTPNYKCKNILL